MKIAVAQLNSCVGDFASQTKRMIELDTGFSAEGADLVIYPSCFITPPTTGPLLDHPTFRMDYSKSLAKAFSQLNIPTIVPVMYSYMGEAQPEIIFVEKGKIFPLRMTAYARFLKQMSGTHSAENEDIAIQAYEGSAQTTLRFRGKSFLFAMDQNQMRSIFEKRPESFLEMLGGVSKQEHFDAVIFMPFMGFNRNNVASAAGASLDQSQVCAWAKKKNTWILCVNGLGAFDEEIFTGASYLVTPWGEIKDILPPFEQATKLLDINFGAEGPLKKPAQLPPFDSSSFTYETLCLATQDFIEKAQFEGASFVLTGDMMTSTCAVLLADALGPKNVFAVIAPLEEGSQKEKNSAFKDALGLAKELHISHLALEDKELETTLLVNPSFSSESSSSVPAISGIEALDAHAKILLARARASLEASKRNYANITAADKTAFCLGQDFDGWQSSLWAPFSDVYRSGILEMAQSRNHVSAVIKGSTLKRLNLLTLEEKGKAISFKNALNYLKTIDYILHETIESGRPLALLENDEVNTNLTFAVIKRLFASEKYRFQMPLGPIISAYSLRERSFPVMSKWVDRFASDEDEQKKIASDGEEDLEAYLGQLVDQIEPEGQEMSGFSERLGRNLENSLESENMSEDVASALNSLSDAFSSGIMNSQNGSDDIFDMGLFSNN